jgi:7,8-dihydropterin-6-yl-methyl-4-(beta-D-ribofuranosyl)aminobenzene 5'-phosphate synthase
MKRKMLFMLLLVVAAVVVFFGVHQALAQRTIAQDWENVPNIVPELMTTSRLEIVPLYEEATASSDLISGHGVSYLIRTDTATILLDIGHNPDRTPVAPFMQNLQALGVDFNEIDRVVISHLHPDHVGGLTAWRQRTLSFGELPGEMGERLVFVPDAVQYKGAIHATIPTLPAPDIATTGVMAFAEPWPLSLRAPVGYEQALVIQVAEKGLVLITGCGHPILEKLVARAESLYGAPVVGVVGGLHYEGLSAEDIQPQIAFLQSRSPVLVALSPHDSSPEVLTAFESAFGEAYHTLRVGETIRLQGN